MGTGIITLLVSLGAATWTFAKLQDRTGRGNNRDAVTGAVVVFVVVGIVVFSLTHLLLP